MALPEPDELFDQIFRPHYPPGRLEGRMFKATFPDVVGVRKGVTAEEASGLPPKGIEYAANCIERMVEAAKGDWPQYLPVSGEIDLAWIRAFDEKHDEAYVAALLEQADAADFGNNALISCCEFGAVLGHVLKGMRPELIWVYDVPYWDSWLYSPEKGLMINVFSWAMKKFSAYGIGDGYAEKLVSAAGMLA